MLHEHSPLGIALFARNIKTDEKGKQNKEALAQLITDIKEILGKFYYCYRSRGGYKVQRLTKPTFYNAPPAKDFGDLAKDQGLEIAIEKCKQNYRNIGKELKALGINLDFAPVGDISHKGAHDVIGNRSFGAEPEIVVPLCI